MKVSFEGIAETAATFYCEGVTAGQPVKLADNAKVVPAAGGDSFLGVTLSAGEDFACVQIGGAVGVPFSGAAPALGFSKLCADGAGGVKSGGSREYAVLAAQSGKVTFLL